MKTRFYLFLMLLAAAFLLPPLSANAAKVVRQRPVMQNKAADVENIVRIAVSQDGKRDTMRQMIQPSFAELATFLNDFDKEEKDIDPSGSSVEVRSLFGSNNEYKTANIVFYLIEDITFNPNLHHIISIPQNVTIDGRYHKIEMDKGESEKPISIQLQEETIDSITYYIGGMLFGSNEGTITRLGIYNSEEESIYDTEVVGGETPETAMNIIISVFCGKNTGTIDQCFTNINEFAPKQSGDTWFLGAALGGIVGYNNGTIQNCYADNKIHGGQLYFGTAYGTAIGLAGDNSKAENVLARLEDYTIGNVSITSDNTSFAGNQKGTVSGYVASSFKGDDENNVAEVKDGDFNVDNVKPTEDQKSFLGYFAPEIVNGENYGLIGFAESYSSESLVGNDELINDMLSQPTIDELYLYKTVNDDDCFIGENGLKFMSLMLAAAQASPSDNIILSLGITKKELSLYQSDVKAKDATADIPAMAPVVTLDLTNDNTPAFSLDILPDGWTFDGKLSTVAAEYPGNLGIEAPLFGTVGKGATVKNLVLVYSENGKYLARPECYFSDGKPFDAIGAVASVNYGTIENIVAEGRLCVDFGLYEANYKDELKKTCYKDLHVGGIVGYNFGNVKTIWSNLCLNVNVNCDEFTEEDRTSVNVGGIVGTNASSETEKGLVQDAFLSTSEIYDEMRYVTYPIIKIEGEGKIVPRGEVGYIVGSNDGVVNTSFVTGNGLENKYGWLDKLLATRKMMENNENFTEEDLEEFDQNINKDYLDEFNQKKEEVNQIYHLTEITFADYNFETAMRPEFSNKYDDGSKLYPSGINEETSSLSEKECFNKSKSLFNFINIGRWKMFNDQVEVWSGDATGATAPKKVDIAFPYPNFSECEESLVAVDEEDKVVLEVCNEFEYDDVSNLVLESNELYGSATINLRANLDLSTGIPEELYNKEWNEETLLEDVVELPSFGTADAPFTGAFNGNNFEISNMRGAFADGSLFNTIGVAEVPASESSEGQAAQRASVSNITFNGEMFVDIEQYLKNMKEGETTVFVPTFAQSLTGEASALNFSGKVWYDDTKVPEGVAVSLCLVDQTTNGEGFESQVGNSYICLFDDNELANEASANKASIVIKQNVGVGRGKANKTASSKMAAQKAAPGQLDFANYLMNDNEEFDAAQFASGEVAAWLNFADPGFNGDFTGMYAQGNGRPKLSTNKSAAVQVINYSAENLPEDANIADYINGPVFAAVGDEVEVAFAQKDPESVTLATSADGAGETQTIADNKISFTLPASESGFVFLKSAYAAEEDPIEEEPIDDDPNDEEPIDDEPNDEEPIDGEPIEEAIVVVDAQNITLATVEGGINISGAEGKTAIVSTLVGNVQLVQVESNSQFVALTRGLYIVRIDGFSAKVLVE